MRKIKNFLIVLVGILLLSFTISPETKHSEVVLKNHNHNDYPCHPNGDVYPCTHPLHYRGDVYPCTHFNVFGQPIHALGDLGPCEHPAHAFGDIGPCTHVCW